MLSAWLLAWVSAGLSAWLSAWLSAGLWLSLGLIQWTDLPWSNYQLLAFLGASA